MHVGSTNCTECVGSRHCMEPSFVALRRFAKSNPHPSLGVVVIWFSFFNFSNFYRTDFRNETCEPCVSKSMIMLKTSTETRLETGPFLRLVMTIETQVYICARGSLNEYLGCLRCVDYILSLIYITHIVYSISFKHTSCWVSPTFVTRIFLNRDARSTCSNLHKWNHWCLCFFFFFLLVLLDSITLSNRVWRLSGTGNKPNINWELFHGYSLTNSAIWDAA